MMRMVLLLFAAALAGEAAADTVVPTRTIRAEALIGPIDVGLIPGDMANGFSRLSDVIGQEARVVLYAGRAIRVDDVGSPALVDRNQIVTLRFDSGGLSILAEARVLERGGLGDHVRVMNLSSRTTLVGRIEADGSVRVHK